MTKTPWLVASALLLSGCIKSTHPIIGSDGSAAETLQQGRYKECQFMHSANGQKEKPSCETVELTVAFDGIVRRTDSSGTTTVAHVRRLDETQDWFVVQTGDSGSGYRYALVNSGARPARFSVLYPDCRIGSNLAYVLKDQGYLLESQQSPSCGIDGAKSADLMTIFKAFAFMRREWKPSYTVEYQWLGR